MACQKCGDSGLEYSPDKEFARCTKCLALHQVDGPGQLTLMDVRAPNGQVDPEFTATFAQNLGFAPRKATQHVVGVGPVGLVVPTGRIERDLRNKVSGFIWGWIVTGIVVAVVAIGGIVFFFYVRSQVQAQGGGQATPAGGPKAMSWDGRSPFTCSGNDVVVLQNVNANIGAGTAVNATGNCQLELDNVNIAAPECLDSSANARVTLKGGSLTARTGNAIYALGNSQVVVQGTKINGKTRTLGPGAKITGAQ